MTAVADPPAAASERPSPGDEGRVADVCARLLPDEITAGRRLRRLKKRIAAGLVALVLVLVAAYAGCWWQTRDARQDLAGVQAQTARLRSQEDRFQPLVDIQGQLGSVQGTLSSLMADDLPWSTLLDTLRADLRGGTLTSVTGTVSGIAAAGAAGANALEPAGVAPIGTLTISGTAPDKGAVADYADRLATAHGLAEPLVTSVSGTGRQVTFSLQVQITAAALGGRFQPATGTSASAPGTSVSSTSAPTDQTPTDQTPTTQTGGH